MGKLKYKRILLKLSGEVFKGSLESGIDGETLMAVAKRIKKVRALGCEVGIVIGAGNIWRYRDNDHLKLSRVVSDQMGMLATNMNAMALESALKELKVDAKAVTAFDCERGIESYHYKSCANYLNDGRVVIFAGGTGNPFFTTDSAAALRALEMECDVLLKATKVDYVYDKDPVKHKDAKKFTKMKYQDVVEQGLGVMDLTCASLLKGSGIPMVVFNMNKKGTIEKAVTGGKIGTTIT